jgi:hypothetical protein
MALGPTGHHFNAYGYDLRAVKRSEPEVYNAPPSSATAEI